MYPQYTTKDITRFWSKVDTSGNCWLWQAGTNEHGYGIFVLGRRKVRAHRFAYMLTYGSTDLNVCHTCDTPGCVRPDHLFAGTQSDNMQDMTNKGRHGSVAHKDQWARGDRHGSHTKPENLKRGEQVHTARLQPDQVRTIRSLNAQGVSQYVIAEMYHIAQTNVSAIVTHKTWKHID